MYIIYYIKNNYMFRHFSVDIFRLINELYTYLYHHIVVLDKDIHSTLVFYKHNGDDEPYESNGAFGWTDKDVIISRCTLKL